MSRTPNNHFIEILRRAIASGRYANAAFLPSERKLAEDFGVGRGVVRNALRTLAGAGVVTLIPHRGACVTPDQSGRRFRRFMLCCSRMPGCPHELLALLSGVCVAASNIYAEVLVSFADSDQPIDNIDEIIYRFQQGELQGLMLVEQRLNVCDIRANGIPCVVINQENSYAGINCRIDHRGIGRLAGARLAASGHRRIGAITGELGTLTFREMLAGFRGALAEEEIELDKKLIFELPPTFSDANYRALVEFFRHVPRPAAFFAMRDVRAEFCYRACAELGIRIPEEISLIGYDNLSWPDAAAAGLTSIRQPVDKLAAAAVAMLKNWCETGQPPQSVVIPGEIIERRSIAAPPRR